MSTRPPFLPNFWKDVRNLVLPRAHPALADAIARVPVDHDTLRAAHARSSLAREPDSFVLYRILGNDLPPRHLAGQSLANLRFLLDHEPALPGCEKRWVVNRVADPAAEARLLDLLHSRRQPVLHLPFIREDYARVPLDTGCLRWPGLLRSPLFRVLPARTRSNLLCAVRRLKNIYAMNNNGARNAALSDGRARAKWVLPFDGNCFFTAEGWAALAADVSARPWLSHFAVPMARVLDNRDLLSAGFAPPAREEPQVLFRRDSAAVFNEAFPYGRRPKVELLWHLGIPGPWDDWSERGWDQPRRPLSPEARRFGAAGWVARLYSGSAHLETAGTHMPAKRGVARRQGVLALLDELDLAVSSNHRP